jgi:hypothetical protein
VNQLLQKKKPDPRIQLFKAILISFVGVICIIYATVCKYVGVQFIFDAICHDYLRKTLNYSDIL